MNPIRKVVAVRGASEHNLKHVDVDVPRDALVVVTGVSGSGKSSLAFDTICAEGRRRYLETFSSYARQYLGRLARPAVTAIDGLSPAIALDQSFSIGNPRSTVGTLSEIYDLLRLLFARRGERPGGTAEPKLERQLFSFNSPFGACPVCRGLGVEDRLDPALLVADASRTVRAGALRLSTPNGYLIYSQVTIDVLDQVCRAHGFNVDIPWQDLTAGQRDVILNGSDRIRVPYGKHPLESRLRWTGITAKPREEGVYKGILPVMEQTLRQKRTDNILRFVRSMPCRACGGSRLRPEALAVRFRGRTIAEFAAQSVDALHLDFPRGGHPDPVVAAVGDHIAARSGVMRQLGLGHLTLDRESTTLSGGEAQRLRLARQAGIGLGGMIYVLDEPSIGLHAHDTGRLLGVLAALRDQGNTVIAVEHDEQTIRSADWVIDIGPGAGTDGGSVVYTGPVAGLTAPPADPGGRAPASRTRAFLTGQERIDVPARRRAGRGSIRVSGLNRHNLRNVDAEFRQGAFNAVTGVSGAGKSTLVAELRRLLAGDGAGGGALQASIPVDVVIAIDQTPIGRTPRSNPATYTGVFERIRDVFAALPDAAHRGFGKGRFSFNVAGGRCDACEGAGVTEVGMQFLGTVSVTCERCGGRRFNDETLAVRYRGRHIHDVLEMPIADACAFFADQPAILRGLGMMRTLGLGYLRVGHPATMLSGGEAQRVKLAAELAKQARGHVVYVLDEPTVGLHAADIVLLLAAVEGLVAKGHTVVAIEHHLDVIKVADRVVDLGPGSGEAGGRVVVAGTPEDVAACAASLTGAALRRVLPPWILTAAADASAAGEPTGAHLRAPVPPVEPLRLTNVCTHNLQHLDVTIPRDRVTVITGVSGCGKSSLAFDTVFAEGQQRYAGTFSTYARRFVQRADAAEFDTVTGLTPTVAISQQAPSRNPRSTVATLTEIHDLYRLLFSRGGRRHCPACAAPLDGGGCPACGFCGAGVLTSAMFSPNSESGACPSCRGVGHIMSADPGRLVTDPSRPIAAGAMAGHKTGRFYGDPHGQHMAVLTAAGAALGIDFGRPWADLDEGARNVVLNGTGDRIFDVEWRYKRGARSGVHRFRTPWAGLLELVRQEYGRKHGDKRGDALEPLMTPVPCAACRGGQLGREALAVRFGSVNIHELLSMTVEDSAVFFADVDAGAVAVPPPARALTADLRTEAARRLSSLLDAGLGYLTLGRPAATLSGGEAQRVRLAAEIRSGLTGITYVLDEPTIGLHARDTERLIGLMRALRDAGNSVLVVEHDLDVIAAADHVIELGPGAGDRGGRLVAEGEPDRIRSNASSRTGWHLRRTAGLLPPASADAAAMRLEPGSPRRSMRPGLAIGGAHAHNLQSIDLDVPAGGLIAVTGVSGSGKSSLVFDVIVPSFERARTAGPAGAAAPVNCDRFEVHEPFARIVGAGRAMAPASPWSTPATQAGLFDHLREIFAASPDAAARALTKADFSTMSGAGRCTACDGLGEIHVAMDFLPDVWLTCESCGGARFGDAVLACRVEGRSMADILSMSIDDACGSLGSDTWRPLAPALGALRDTGLGYVRLGQPARTLSGGERQRLALAVALTDRSPRPVLYVFDEPTKGLHADDVARLLGVFDALVAAGHTVVVVEHNLDVVRHADWVIDLGPEGGRGGGRVVAAGTPAGIAGSPLSHTGRALAR